MPAKKTKAKPAPEVEVKPVEESSPVVVTPMQPTGGPVVIEPPTETPTETVTEPAPAEKPPVVVKEGELASAIADMSKAVENKNFEPVGVSVEPNPQTEVSQTTEIKAGKTPNKKKGPGAWVVLAFLLGLGAGILLGYWLWGREIPGGESTVPVQEESAKPKPTLAPVQATPSAEKIDRSKLKIQVLNGTGGSGVAAKARDLLESMGYKDVGVGNADQEDYVQTEIAIKNTMKSYFDTLKADLSGKYQVASEASVLATGSIYDAIVTIGEK